MSHGIGVFTRVQAWPLPAPRPWSDLQAQVEQLARSIDAALMQLDPDWIGHVKLLLADAGAAAYLSVTYAGEPLGWSGKLVGETASATLTIYLAVWGLDPEQIGAALDPLVLFA